MLKVKLTKRTVERQFYLYFSSLLNSELPNDVFSFQIQSYSCGIIRKRNRQDQIYSMNWKMDLKARVILGPKIGVC